MFGRQGLFLVISMAVLAVTGCGGETPPAASIEESPATAAPEKKEAANAGVASSASAPRSKPQANLFPEVLIKTSQGEIRVRLNAEKAPVTVDNFLANYVSRDFYTGTIVHYVDANKMWIAGGFDSQFVPKEVRAPILNEADNGLKNKRGTIAMVRDPQYSQSATSQFFFNLVDNADLDHTGTAEGDDFGYCVFGEVVSGMDVVDAIAKAAVHDHADFVSTPIEPIVIQSVEQVK